VAEPASSPVPAAGDQNFEVYDSENLARQAELSEQFERLRKIVKTARFHVTRKDGYLVTDVDMFMDMVEGLLADPITAKARQDILDLVGSTRFHMAYRHGYEVADVDTFCDTIVNQLSDH